jgi:hypothetical protein
MNFATGRQPVEPANFHRAAELVLDAGAFGAAATPCILPVPAPRADTAWQLWTTPEPPGTGVEINPVVRRNSHRQERWDRQGDGAQRSWQSLSGQEPAADLDSESRPNITGNSIPGKSEFMQFHQWITVLSGRNGGSSPRWAVLSTFGGPS